jgi:AI-2E family transporter
MRWSCRYGAWTRVSPRWEAGADPNAGGLLPVAPLEQPWQPREMPPHRPTDQAQCRLIGVTTSGSVAKTAMRAFGPVSWETSGWRGETGWAVFVLGWHLALVLPIEVFGRPFFISRDTGLPLLLVFVGVLGGLLAFGFIGVFVGPTVLAVSYAMLLRWLGPLTRPGEHPGHHIEQSGVPRH